MGQQYSVTDLGNCGGLAYSFGINDSGAVVGYLHQWGETERPFLWTPAGARRILARWAETWRTRGRSIMRAAWWGIPICRGTWFTMPSCGRRLRVCRIWALWVGALARANGINGVGQVAGESDIASGNESDVFFVVAVHRDAGLGNAVGAAVLLRVGGERQRRGGGILPGVAGKFGGTGVPCGRKPPA